jgi:hypothetical protein
MGDRMLSLGRTKARSDVLVRLLQPVRPRGAARDPENGQMVALLVKDRLPDSVEAIRICIADFAKRRKTGVMK